jgi:hypothetical protein
VFGLLTSGKSTDLSGRSRKRQCQSLKMPNYFFTTQSSMVQRRHTLCGCLDEVLIFENCICTSEPKIDYISLGEGGQLAYGEDYKATPVLVEQLAGKRFVGGSANWLYTALITGTCNTCVSKLLTCIRRGTVVDVGRQSLRSNGSHLQAQRTCLPVRKALISLFRTSCMTQSSLCRSSH